MSDRFVEECRKLITTAITSGDDDIDRETITEVLSGLGHEAFRLEWDSGGPGAGAGTELVYEFQEKYFTASADFGWNGPYESLDEALGGRIIVTGATREISCWEWTDEELIARMELHDPQPVIRINGTDWPLERLEHEVQTRKGSG